MDATAPRLEADGLTCVRGDRRLFHQLSLSLGAGQVLRVEGDNGAGKTSLLRILAGLGLPALGEVRWNGLAIARQRERYGRSLLYLGHLGALKDELTPEENLLTDAQLGGWPGVDRDRVLDALDRMGLRRVAALPARVLSAGQRRRTALTRLLLSPAPLWVLDEPFNALDVAAVEQLGRTLSAHTARGGLVVLTSHQPLALDGADLQRLRLAP
jgi:heme exporter protein A